MKNKKEHFQALVIQYATSILQLVEGITPKNINEVTSLIKANIRVLENDVKNSFKRQDNNYNYRDYN